MDENRSRRVSLANEIATWSVELPALLAKILVAAKRTDLPGRQKLDLEVTARRINTLFNAVGVTPDAGADGDALLEELIQNTDRLRELITSAKGTVEAISKLPPNADPQTPAARAREWRSSFVNRPKR